MQSRISWRRPAAVAAALALLAGAAPTTVLAQSGGPFAGLGGSWSGSGQIRLEGGQREAIRCSAHYVSRGGSGLGLALRCASPSGRVELRASLAASGGHVSGTWEERTYGLAGSVSGSGSGSSLRLSFSGSVSGSMTVNTSGGSQSISVRTGSQLQSVSVSLRRN